MPATPITPAMQAVIDERVKLELKKRLPKKLIPFGRIVPSKRHDFEANLLTYKTDENGQLVTEENDGKKGFVFDRDMKPLIISTATMRMFLDGKAKSILVSIEADEP